MSTKGICKLCGDETHLDNSHIFAKALLNDIRGSKQVFVGINGRGRYGRELLQDGEKERLFCRACENFCSKHYEKPFCDMWYEAKPRPLPERWPSDLRVDVKVEYAPFKLFHLLNLYRASVSSLPSFQRVHLGPHERVIQKMLLERDPGPRDLYAVAPMGVIEPSSRTPSQIITMPVRYGDGGHTIYCMVYAGVQWAVLVSRDGAPALRRSAIMEDGTFSMTCVSWEHLTVMQEASQLISGRDLPPLRPR